MNIELYINNQIVDIDEEIDISLEKDFQDTDKLIVEEVTYSFDVELPVTDRNRLIFGFSDVFDVSNKFGKSYNSRLYVDGGLILDGKFILNEISGGYYSGNLYVPERQPLKDVLGDLQLRDITPHEKYISTWKDVERINNYVMNVGGEYPDINYRDNHIMFPYVLYSLPYNRPDTSYAINVQDLSASGNTFSLDNIYPSFNVLSVIKDIFSTEGYSVSGNVFSDTRFTGLYQTYEGRANEYAEEKYTPYYLKFNCDYKMRKNNNISPTLMTNEINDGYIVGADAPLIAGSGNTVISNEDDDYNMLVKGSDDNYTIVVPKSGWYRIRVNGNMLFPLAGGHYGQNKRQNVVGMKNDADQTDFSRNIAEFQIKRGNPLTSTDIYSMNCILPVVPTEYVKDTDSNNGTIDMYDAKVMLKAPSSNSQMMCGKNGKEILIRDLSGADVYDFICGARFGCIWNLPNASNSRHPNRNKMKMACASLMNPSKTTHSYENGDGEIYIPLYDSPTDDNARYDYGWRTAQALVLEDSYSNFTGYNTYEIEDDGDIIWDTTSNYRSRSFNGMPPSTASTTTVSSSTFTVDTVVWLDKGETLYAEIVVPFNNYREDCHWYEACNWKNRKYEGVLDTDTNFTFEMGFVSNDEQWKPTDLEGVPTFNQIKAPRLNNVNKFLPQMKANDYLENFLQTFNLKMTLLSEGAYSIDYGYNGGEMGEVIDLDEYANIEDASFSRVDSPSNLILNWQIDTKEEGYDDSDGYTGSLVVSYPTNTSGTENKKQSIWSYTWLKDITFTGGTIAYRSGTEKVPVICDKSVWDGTFQLNDGTEPNTSLKSRFIYLSKDIITSRSKYIEVQKYTGDTTNTRIMTKLPLVTNYLESKDNLNVTHKFKVDYNNSPTNTRNGLDKTITDSFFNITKPDVYQVDVDVALPNHIFSKMRSNTLVKFNDGLFRVVKVEGHDISMESTGTLSLISL